jgi:hypothetical protein
MLPPEQYRKWTYPPPGRGWLQFGDKELNKAIDSISKEAHDAMTVRRDSMREVHDKYLERNNYFSVKAQHKAFPPAPPPSPVEHYSIADPEETRDPEEGYHSAEEGPSRTKRMLEGAKQVVKNHAWPFTRDILLPAAAEVTVGATKGTASAAVWLASKSFWTLADVLWGLNTGTDIPSDEGEGNLPLGWGDSSGSGDKLRIGNSRSRVVESEDELAKKGKGYLVEEIYKEPGWAHLFGREDSNGYTNDDVTMFRKKLGKMSQRDLAKILVQLQSGS